MVRLSHPLIRWWGSPDVGRKSSCWAAQKNDRWLNSMFYVLKATAKLPSKKIVLDYISTKRI